MEDKTYSGLLWLVNLIPYVGLLVYIVMWIVKRDSDLVNHNGKQILGLILASIVVSIVCFVLMLVFIGFVLLAIWAVVGLVLFIIGTVRAFQGRKESLPLVGWVGELF